MDKMESDPRNSTQDKNLNDLIHSEIINNPNKLHSNLIYFDTYNFIDDFILNYINKTNNIKSEEMCLNGTQHGIENDNNFDEDFDIILDLEHYESITKIKEVESNPNTAQNSKGPLDDHNYCLKPRPQKHDTTKLKDFYNFETFNDLIHNHIDDALKSRKENLDSSKSEKNMSTFQSKQPEIHIISDESENEFKVFTTSDDNDTYCEIINEVKSAYDGHINNNQHNMTHEKDVKTMDIPKKYGFRNSTVIKEHDIPNATEYINMFETYIPYPTYCMENKSIYRDVVNIEYQDIGFNMRLCKNDDLKENIINEAEESKRMILSMYPSENRRLRRRRH